MASAPDLEPSDANSVDPPVSISNAPLSGSTGESGNNGYNPYRRRGRRQLNVSAIKSVVVFAVGAITALIGGLTGLGAQSAFAPMLTWMLGFGPEKAQGTAMNFGMWAALAASAGAYVSGATPPGYVLSAVMLVAGAIVGAILMAGVSKKVQGQVWRRTSQGIGIALGMVVVVQVAHTSGLFAAQPNLANWSSPVFLLLMGVGTGAVTQLLGLTSGALLVPVLYFGTGLRTLDGSYAAPAVSLSVLVIALASALPAFAYGRRGLVDTLYRTPAVVAGLVGGFCGGVLLAHLQGRLVILFSAAVAMFLCARELSRLAFEKVQG